MLKEVLERAEEAGIPGGEVVLGEGGREVFYSSYGYKTLIPDPLPWKKGLYLDLASITKPLVTAHLVLWLAQQGELSPGDEIRKFFPEAPWNPTLLELATHTSGLPPWVPLYRRGPGRKTMTEELFSLRPGERGTVKYSCMGYFLLGLVVERITSRRLGEFAREFFQKRGMDLRMGKAFPAVPTEMGNQYEKAMAPDARVKFRDYLIEGEVHDGNSFYWGGDGGNAGAFSRAGEILKYPLLFEELGEMKELAQFPLKGIRSFGWETRGRVLLHHGFTGGTILFSPDKGRVAFLYLNRTHPFVRKEEVEEPRRLFLKHALGFLKGN